MIEVAIMVEGKKGKRKTAEEKVMMKSNQAIFGFKGGENTYVVEKQKPYRVYIK